MLRKAINYLHECSECVNCQYPAHALTYCPKNKAWSPREFGIFCDKFEPALEVIAPASDPGMAVLGI